MTGLEHAYLARTSPQWTSQTRVSHNLLVPFTTVCWCGQCTVMRMLLLLKAWGVVADATLETLPAQHSITFGTATARNNAVLRLEVEEVELLSESWLVQGFKIPVCGEAPRPLC